MKSGRTLSWRSRRWRWSWLICLLAVPVVWGESIAVQVADPFIELHSGPGRGFPVVDVVERGGAIEVHQRHTDWFRVSTPRGRTGWVHRTQLVRTLFSSGESVVVADAGAAEFSHRSLEISAMGGDFDGANLASLGLGLRLGRHLLVEAHVERAFGHLANLTLWGGGIHHQPFPDWRVAPYFGIGFGAITIEPSTAVVQPQDRDEQYAAVALGLQAYVAQRFSVRLEYRAYQVFTNRDDNEDPAAWKFGFSFFL